MSESVQTLEFQAEARQMLDLVIHSVYSNKDIFLRELISNASDALDKLRVEALLDKDLGIDTSDLHISITADKEKRTLTIADNGLGMTREEVVSNIGTIAHSGTADFIRTMKESRGQAVSAELIGQFGIGFYSSFMVADRVTLVTRRAGHTEATRWESQGDGTYTVEATEAPSHGTSITLHLKPADVEDGLGDYVQDWKIRDIVKRYSDFISYPIRLAGDTLNSMKAIWARPKAEVEQREYNEFYKHISHDWNDPLRTIQMKAEGTFEYEALLFIPSRSPLDLLMHDAKRGIHLYVKRVFIMDDCEAIMPDYLRFVRGVVDAQDLSLNVSREILQQDRQIQQMRRRLVKKVLDTVEDIKREDADAFRTFWKEFGKLFKVGLYQDAENREKLLELCVFDSTASSDGPHSLEDYVGRMKEGQQAIYYVTGENRAALEKMPHLEVFRSKGYEVLILSDPVDEVWPDMVGQYKGHRLQSVAKGDIELGTEEERKQAEAQREEHQKELASLLAWMGTVLAEDIKEVRLSGRLTSSPACLVGDPQDPTPSMERLMRAMGQEPPKIKRVLEVNGEHPMVKGLHAAYEQRKDDPALREIVHVLQGLALLAEGGDLADPSEFARRVADLAVKGLS